MCLCLLLLIFIYFLSIPKITKVLNVHESVRIKSFVHDNGVIQILYFMAIWQALFWRLITISLKLQLFVTTYHKIVPVFSSSISSS